MPAPPARADRGFVRAVVRLHAALGAVEVAVPADGRGGLVTLVDDEDRWPWWGSALPGLRTELGSPLVRLTAEGWSGRAVSGRGGTR